MSKRESGISYLIGHVKSSVSWQIGYNNTSSTSISQKSQIDELLYLLVLRSLIERYAYHGGWCH
jgi:hypothetical protein